MKIFLTWRITFVLVLLSALLTACDQATTTASCAFLVGDGLNGNDAKVRSIIYPGQQVPNHVNEKVYYVPCNSRNYIVNDGTVKNANGAVVGDRSTLISATTKSGVPITIAARALWTLNQSDRAMRAFYNVCFKYQCASSEDVGGDANFSTPGWNGMLAENLGPALDTAARMAAIEVDDSVWQNHNPLQYKALGDKMSEVFADVMRANWGYSEDLFCGSGNSMWADPENPGTGEFTCTPVRIIVDDVQRGEVMADDSTEGVTTINQQRLKNAQALYGESAGYWLGLQDSIDKCKEAQVPCVFNIGGAAASPAVVVPANTPVPVPTATPAQ